MTPLATRWREGLVASDLAQKFLVHYLTPARDNPFPCRQSAASGSPVGAFLTVVSVCSRAPCGARFPTSASYRRYTTPSGRRHPAATGTRTTWCQASCRQTACRQALACICLRPGIYSSLIRPKHVQYRSTDVKVPVLCVSSCGVWCVAPCGGQARGMWICRRILR